MPGVRLILALHDHQPVGNFDGVFEASYRDAYLPFLGVMEDYPDIPFALHTSGPLLEWLVDRKPDYVARVRRLAEAGRVEVVGGGFYEPILTMIPPRDRIGQVATFARHVEEIFGVRPRGAWLAERVWEQSLASGLADAGVEYVALDDSNFERAGVEPRDLRGHFLTEDDGRLLKVFPIAERLRYLIPFREPHAIYEYLRRIADEGPDAVLVFADDGEKFGAWPGTHDHVYRDGWLRRFCDMIVANLDWLRPTTFAEAADATLPRGTLYLPDSSYREMTEWVLPAARLSEYESASRATLGDPAFDRVRPFVRAGGYWRNFKAKYAETAEMYARMMEVSNRLDRLGATGGADPDFLESARSDLYRSQCNCPYWHGAFGGLYLPHLRNAIYRHLIAADAALDDAEGISGPRARVDVADFNLDARQEARLANDRLVAYVRPAQGGHVYELDVRHCQANVLATLDRRPEAYHAAIAAAARGEADAHAGPPSILDRVVLKQEGLDRRLAYDRFPRKSLVDHFLPPGATLDDLAGRFDGELGDFALGTYLARVRRGDGEAAVLMERPGTVAGRAIRVEKSIALESGSDALDVRYVLHGLPEGVPIRFAVEFNLAAMAGHAHDRYYADPAGRRLGMLDARLDLDGSTGIALADEWLDLGVGLSWSEPAGLWAFPIETVSQSEGGFEGVYQSSCVVPHWSILPDASGRWEVRVRWALGRAGLAAGEGGAEGAGVVLVPTLAGR